MSFEKNLGFLKEALIKIGYEGAMLYICAQVPFLNLPVVKQIVGFIVKYIITIIMNETELGIYWVYTDNMTEEQQKKFEEIALKRIDIKKSGDKDAIAKSDKEFIDAARLLIKLRA